MALTYEWVHAKFNDSILLPIHNNKIVKFSMWIIKIIIFTISQCNGFINIIFRSLLKANCLDGRATFGG